MSTHDDDYFEFQFITDEERARARAAIDNPSKSIADELVARDTSRSRAPVSIAECVQYRVDVWDGASFRAVASDNDVSYNTVHRHITGRCVHGEAPVPPIEYDRSTQTHSFVDGRVPDCPTCATDEAVHQTDDGTDYRCSECCERFSPAVYVSSGAVSTTRQPILATPEAIPSWIVDIESWADRPPSVSDDATYTTAAECMFARCAAVQGMIPADIGDTLGLSRDGVGKHVRGICTCDHPVPSCSFDASARERYFDGPPPCPDCLLIDGVEIVDRHAYRCHDCGCRFTPEVFVGASE